MSVRRRLLRRKAPVQPGTPPGRLHPTEGARTPRMEVFLYGPDTLVERVLEDPAEIRGLRGRAPVLWLNVVGTEHASTLEAIGSIFGLHPLALEDVLHAGQRAKVEDYDTFLFVVAPMLAASETLETEQLSLFLGDGYLITFQTREGDFFDSVRHRIRSGRRRIRGSGPDYLAYALLDAVVDSYFPPLDRLGRQLEELDDEVLQNPVPETARKIQSVKSDLLTLRTAIWPLREALRQLTHEEDERIADETRLYLRDSYDHATQVTELVTSFREMAGDLMNVYLASVSNRMNEIMKFLTLVATIFIPLGFIAGVYGMNFNPDVSPWNMPELNWYFGYPFALGLMAGVALGLVWFFRRKGWLD